MEFLSHIRSIVGCVEGDGQTQKFIPELVQMYKNGKVSCLSLQKSDGCSRSHAATSGKDLHEIQLQGSREGRL